jgi:hypothetical protein
MRILVEAIPIRSPIAEQTPKAFISIISLTLFITCIFILRLVKSTMQFREINNYRGRNLFRLKIVLP